MEPRVTRREKKLHLSYELPHRLHHAAVYPLLTPNGSTIIIYGHERGIRVLWRDGRRRKDRPAAPVAPPQPNGISKKAEVIELSDDEDDDVPQQAKEAAWDESMYESEEDERDPDCPYPSIIQDVDIDLDTEVFRFATTTASSTTARSAKGSQSHITVAAVCTNGTVKILRIPLCPPNDAGIYQYTSSVLKSGLELLPSNGVPHDLAIKVIPRVEEDASAVSAASKSQLLVAAASSTVDFWRISIAADGHVEAQSAPFQTVRPPSRAHRVVFHPSPRSTTILLSDGSGAVRVYDPLASSASRPSSRDSASAASQEVGKWITSYRAPFETTKTNATTARQKRILDASWTLGGRGVLVLLEDGEWGIWDLTGQAQAGKGIEDFTVRGFLGSSSTMDATEPSKQRKGASKLAPMTPNTRKAKAENLFVGPTKTPGVALNGGISVATGSGRPGQADESVVMWYGNDIYSIASMQTFWQRSTSSGGGGSGSLYTPGLTHITDINLMNENITSISAFTSSPPPLATGLGQMNVQRDLLVSAEHRFVILQNVRPPAPTRATSRRIAEEQLQPSRDQRMLDAGELDIAGVDRVLDGMAGGGDARPRKVGFAH